jgi:type I restriction enzyme S subunit
LQRKVNPLGNIFLAKNKNRRMKDSGVEWIGEIPEDWSVRKLRQVFDFNSGLSITKSDLIENGIKTINYGEIHSKYKFDLDLERDVLKGVDERYLKTNRKSLMTKGDFVFCDTSEDREGSGNCIFVREDRGMRIFAGSHTIVGKLKIKAEPVYIRYMLSARSIKDQISSAVVGIKVYSITQAILKNIIGIFPPLKEQRKIANFLDQKAAQIDHIIERTKESIEEYKKYKQSLITETVTKGLNPDVEMKDSGIEWIGEIPKHWEIKRIKQLSTVNPNKSEIRCFSPKTEVTFLPMEKIMATGKVDYSLKGTIGDLIDGYTCFKDNDIILAKVTPCFENRNIAIVTGLLYGVGFGTTELHVLRCNNNCFNRYLFYYLQSSIFISKGASEMYGVAGLKRVPVEFVLNHKLGVPSYAEQQQIAKYLDFKCNEIDNIIAKKERLISDLESYKKSLIYEYVTGKKRVV